MTGKRERAPEAIDTARLHLRRPLASDADAIFMRYASDPEVTRLLGWPRHERLEQTAAFLAFSDDHWSRWPAGPYLIEARAGGRVLGSTGLMFDAPTSATTGFVLARDAWGQGYATEALAAITALAASLGIERLVALCHHTHRASAHVLEKCGFVRDGSEPALFPNLGPEPEAAWRYVRR